ncbi:MAG: 6-phosphofructokinase, partial [Candidatus Omnitrophota bacterium]
AEKRGAKISIIGIPKTVDNDIMYIDHTFGFATAFSEATRSISSAHNEAKASPNGIGLVKLMGRNSGFIACFAALGMTDVNFVLIPEVPFKLDGEQGFLNILRQRLKARSHAVIVVAEGAGQEYAQKGPLTTDASGNPKLMDIGLFLKDRIAEYFHSRSIEINIKYIDPSYIIRSIPANGYDKVYCVRLGQVAVHAAMSGNTEMVVGAHHGYMVYLPMALIAKERQRINPNGPWWEAVISATGQPVSFG